MTESPMGMPRRMALIDMVESTVANGENILTFANWAEEAVYMALPYDWNDSVEQDSLIVRVACSEAARRHKATYFDVRRAIRSLVRQEHVSSFMRDGLWHLAKTNRTRSVALQFT